MENMDISIVKEAKDKSSQPLVLVIDDNPSQQKLYDMIKQQLEIVPCIVSNCNEGIQAAEYLNFDLILMDVKMPHVDGVNCARKIQEMESKRGIKTPIVAVTAHAMPGDRDKCLDAGMDDYISKPFSLQELKHKIAVWAA